MTENNEPKIDVNKAFEAIARIIGAREHMDIKVISVRKRNEETKEDTA